MAVEARDCWSHILNELGPRGQNFTTWSVFRPLYRPFRARAVGNSIIVDSPSITVPRTIHYREFECVFSFYEDYINLVSGIRPKMRDKCGWNISYIITLIHEFCAD